MNRRRVKNRMTGKGESGGWCVNWRWRAEQSQGREGGRIQSGKEKEGNREGRKEGVGERLGKR